MKRMLGFDVDQFLVSMQICQDQDRIELLVLSNAKMIMGADNIYEFSKGDTVST
jgi:hypothetical protein